jgi:PAB-dependent poly(A)-specific ribonuclease subunit 3
VLRPDPSHSLQEHQAEDFIKLGRMMLAIACNNPMAAQSYPASLEYIAKQYSSNLRDQIYLLSSGQIKNIDDFAKNIASHSLQNLNSALHYEDILESELTRELENGRIVRLLCKFGFINERPEFDHDPRWSETGDRYYIKLFRDYVFHSVDENGNPVVDIAHVLKCLNKLDAGVEEKVMLVSRDTLNCFVLSYKDVRDFSPQINVIGKLIFKSSNGTLKTHFKSSLSITGDSVVGAGSVERCAIDVIRR